MDIILTDAFFTLIVRYIHVANSKWALYYTAELMGGSWRFRRAYAWGRRGLLFHTHCKWLIFKLHLLPKQQK